MKTDVLIIGGGLAGLALADAMERAGVGYLLLEARNRFGGRVKTERARAGAFDLGPAWFWQGQPRIAALIKRFGLGVFEQHHIGALCFEDDTGRIEHGRGFSSMQGSWRMDGGLTQLTNALAAGLPERRKRLNATVTELHAAPDGISVTLADETAILARRVAIALPPRLAIRSLTFSPALTARANAAMANIPTWMAGQGKAIAVYDAPFWRDDGLSGDAMSRVGPLVEIHDASPPSGAAGALFGFIGVPPRARLQHDLIRSQIIAQLVRVFGKRAGTPSDFFLKDWASDALTATIDDQQPIFSHPHYGYPAALQGLWDGRIDFCGTEVAQEFGGYLEGALEAAEATASRLLAHQTSAARPITG